LATPDATVGSIGVVMVHLDQTKMLHNVGITATVMRAGKYKMLVNPYEPLSETAKKQIQAQLDAIYDNFVGHVATSLGKSADLVAEKMAQGRVFMGQKAVDVGLAHRLATFSEVLTALDPQYAVDISRQMNKNRLR
jgi:ClpP class serine protease